MMKLLKTCIAGMLLLLLSCSNQTDQSITGYAVHFADDQVLIVEAIQHSTTNQIEARDAVWITNLKDERIGSLLTVKLGDGYDTYPGVSSAKKIIQEQQLPGEKEIIRACLDYANEKWNEGIAVIDNIQYHNANEQWEVVIGNLFNDNSITVVIGKDKVITEK